MKVEWTKEAKATLIEVTEYIREDNPKVARNVISHIHQATERLSKTPYIAPASLKHPKYREMVIPRYPFVIWYQVFEEENLVEINLVWHTSQNRNK